MPLYHFNRLDHAIDEVHALFDAWAENGDLDASLDEDGASVLRLAVHEWIANLVQHAAFPGGPEITLEIQPEAQTVQCSIEDSSVGFDFAGQVEQQHAILDAPAPSERGRGLLMLITCTEALAFQPATPGVRQRIAFRVRTGTGAALFEPLFRDEDLAADFTLIGTLPPDAPHSGDGAAAHAISAPDAP
jgi:serine/threonine-protein kinase RsbW